MAQSPPLLVSATLFAIMFALGMGLPLDGLGRWRQHRLLLPLLVERLDEMERAGLAGVASTFSPASRNRTLVEAEAVASYRFELR